MARWRFDGVAGLAPRRRQQQGLFRWGKNRVGRQLARLCVRPYGETVGFLLYPGSQHSIRCLQPLVLLAERVMKAHQFHHLIWRLDAGFGSDDAIKWVLARDYQLLVKGYNSRRAAKVAHQVENDGWQQLRPNKWVAGVPTRVRYGRRIHTLALKWRTESAVERYALVLHTIEALSPAEVLQLYDARGGTIESDIKQDKIGLQLVRRRKRCWHAQEAWVILSDLAHNLLIWSKDWMFTGSSFETYGLLRLVQDVFVIPGSLEFEGDKLVKVSLQKTHPFAPEMQSCLQALFKNLC